MDHSLYCGVLVQRKLVRERCVDNIAVNFLFQVELCRIGADRHIAATDQNDWSIYDSNKKCYCCSIYSEVSLVNRRSLLRIPYQANILKLGTYQPTELFWHSAFECETSQITISSLLRQGFELIN